jgi:hypothetical protein
MRVGVGDVLTRRRYQDTWKALSDVFGELEAADVLPKIH